MSQQTNAGETGGSSEYPSYEREEELFSNFLREHTILTVVPERIHGDDDDDDDDVMYEPMEDDDGANRRFLRKNCYTDILQRIKDRRYFGSSDGVVGGNTNHTFIIEIPLIELCEWNTEGGDLATRASNNTLRYTEVFSNALDKALAALEPSENYQPIDSAMDILQEQRVQQQEQLEQQRQAATMIGAADDGRGIRNDPNAIAGDQNNNNNGGATEDFPPALMRRYELRILPIGRRGILPPFHHQHVPKQLSTHLQPQHLSQCQLMKQYQDMHSTAVISNSLRHIRSHSMGTLVTVCGMIVRTSDVKPFCTVATYTCDVCGCEVYQVIQNKREFMPQRQCPSMQCNVGNRRVTANRETLHLQTRGSKFIKFQEIKLQELPSQVPMGHVPRSLTVYCRGELTRIGNPGDIVTIDGIFLPQKVGGSESGWHAMKSGLISTTFLDAQNIMVHKKSYDESLLLDGSNLLSEQESIELDKAIMDIVTSNDPIGVLSQSIAPEIFGHDDIKRALLLQLVGGCTRKLPDGIRIRGDINICLMGDPGVAKSQLLKYVANIAPRGVYTTGKGSSGVGLTAAITKDVVTGEMALEGGALVLSDQGICCIDEFDKMDDNDRTAIHEVMEQQTVSIAKAGIVASLNARSAVLAAANPLYSRYNRSKSLSENINLPNSLLSRFDLLFLILDVANIDQDIALAKHVTHVHQNEGVGVVSDDENNADDNDSGGSDNEDDNQNNGDNNPKKKDNHNHISPRVLREYIARARKHQPIVQPDVAPYVVEAYVSLRMQDRPGGTGTSSSNNRGSVNTYSTYNGGGTSDQTVITARQLLSILRLSQALARLRFSDYVAREDVDEAIRLTHMSKASLYNQSSPNNNNTQDDMFATTTTTNNPTTTTGNNNNNKRSRSRRMGEDVMSKIFNIIRDYYATTTGHGGGGGNGVELKLCEAMILRKGFTIQQLYSCLEEYEALDVIQVNRTRTHVYFI